MTVRMRKALARRKLSPVSRKATQAQNRARLEADLAAYFANLPGKVAREEAKLEAAFTESVDAVRFDE